MKKAMKAMSAKAMKAMKAVKKTKAVKPMKAMKAIKAMNAMKALKAVKTKTAQDQSPEEKPYQISVHDFVAIVEFNKRFGIDADQTLETLTKNHQIVRKLPSDPPIRN